MCVLVRFGVVCKVACEERQVLEALTKAFAAVAVPSKAPAMAAYMKNVQRFFGVSSVPRKAAQAAVFKEQHDAIATRAGWERCVRQLWAGPHREYRYAALDLLILGSQKRYGFLDAASLPLLQSLLSECDNWDTLDALATTGFGTVLKHIPAEEMRTILRAMNAKSDHMWTQRAAILSQLKWKSATDLSMLEELIVSRMHDSDFFIRKAIGWALRELARTNPAWVRAFVQKHEDSLSGLSKREALKHIGK